MQVSVDGSSRLKLNVWTVVGNSMRLKIDLCANFVCVLDRRLGRRWEAEKNGNEQQFSDVLILLGMGSMVVLFVQFVFALIVGFKQPGLHC